MLPILVYLALGQVSIDVYKNELLELQQKLQPLVQGEKCSVLSTCTRQTAKKKNNKISPLLKDGAPLVFVSSSMPKESLKALATQAKLYDAKLVIRGMVAGSIQKTAKLSDEIGYPLDIDPKLFETYKITQVPVFLVFHENKWHRLKGNVELSFALETLKKSGK
jgi:type-F conjugative transfer system pilin assembly protein TrbC